MKRATCPRALASGGLVRQTRDGCLDGKVDEARARRVLGPEDAGRQCRLVGDIGFGLRPALGVQRLLVLPGRWLGEPAHGPLLDLHADEAGRGGLRIAYAAGLATDF